MVAQWCQIWAVSRTGRTTHLIFATASCVCKLVWGQTQLWRRGTSFMFKFGQTLYKCTVTVCLSWLVLLWVDYGTPLQEVHKPDYALSQTWMPLSYPQKAVIWTFLQLCLMVPYHGLSPHFTDIMVNPCFVTCDSMWHESFTLILVAAEKFCTDGFLDFFVLLCQHLRDPHAQTLLEPRFPIPTALHNSSVLTWESCLISASIQLLSAVTAVAGQPLQGLSLISVLPILKHLTQHLTVLTPMVCFPYTLFRQLQISMRITYLAVRNSITTLHFIHVPITSAILNCFWVAVWHPSTTHSWETRVCNYSMSDTHSFL
jgi:hypothetical protein